MIRHDGDAMDVAYSYIKYYGNCDTALRSAVKDWMEGSLVDWEISGQFWTVKSVLWILASWRD